MQLWRFYGEFVVFLCFFCVLPGILTEKGDFSDEQKQRTGERKENNGNVQSKGGFRKSGSHRRI